MLWLPTLLFLCRNAFAASTKSMLILNDAAMRLRKKSIDLESR